MAHEKLAQAIIREVPAPFIGRFLETFRGSKLANANGNNCGNACGNSCIDGTGFVFDRYGQAGLTAHDLEAAHKDVGALHTAINSAVAQAIK